MTIKRMVDAAGILPDRVVVTIDGKDDPLIVSRLFKQIIERLAPSKRIDALRRHPEMTETADRLKSLLKNGNANSETLDLIDQAEKEAFVYDAYPRLVRDRRRQEGTKKEKRPEINRWIEKQLRADPSVKSPELWARAPEDLTDRISIDRFKKRVTAARKIIKSAASK